MGSNKRVRDVRKTLGLTLEKFGEPIGLKKSAVSQIENGKNALTDQVAKSICREFNVNEKWLRTGEGEMFIETNSFSLDELASSQDASKLEMDIVRAYFELKPEVRKAALTYFKKISDVIVANSLASEQDTSSASSDIDAKVEAYRRELELEAKATEKSSVSQEDAS